MGFPNDLLVREAMRVLEQRLPRGWNVSEPTLNACPPAADAIVEITAPDKRECSVAVMARARFDAHTVGSLVEAAASNGLEDKVLLVARYLGKATRTRLDESGIGYLDLTGNVRLMMVDPGLYIETHGASDDPNRDERPARSLQGPKCGRIVRALVDHKEPPGVRELAVLTKINAGHVSRILAFLDSEALITRVGRGRLESVDWPALLRRWAQEAPLRSRGEMVTFLEPRGLTAFVARLAMSDERYAVTGDLAAATLTPTAPPCLATVWIRDGGAGVSKLGLHPANSAANVLLIEPDDESVFEGARQKDGVWYAAPSQIAVDLLGAPGRGPTKGEELLRWMQVNPDEWRR
jgi:hypothetical protein